EHVRAALGNEVDWHVLQPNPQAGKPARGSLASVLVTSHADVRRYLDALLGSVALTPEPARGGDFLCPDGRYRIGDVAGTVRRARRSEALIGVVRRQAAAAARREELARERTEAQRELQDIRARARAERENVSSADQRARSLAELTHMLEEVEQRRGETR